MKRLLAGIGSSVLAVMSCSVALAADYPTMVFDATYDVINPSAGPFTMRMMSDGKGHMRTESAMKTGRVISISDYPNLQMLTIMDQGKMALKSKIPPNSYVGSTPEDMKKKNAKDLGSKVVAGHPAHGYEYVSKQGGATYKTEVWNGEDINYLVQSITSLPQGKSTTTLKSFSKAAPPPAVFSMTPPAGYKVMGQ